MMTAAPLSRLASVAAQQTPPRSMRELDNALDLCRACPLWRGAIRGVGGEGPTNAAIMLVGEQPGDQEDKQGRPFVGPAGAVLSRALEAANIDRSAVFVTNGVKHFKNEPRGKRRMHKRPHAGEIEACRWWLSREIELVRPQLIVALGASAARSVLGYKGAIGQLRGQVKQSREAVPAMVTIHPSLLLRIKDETDKKREFVRFVSDLKKARAALTSSREGRALRR